MDSNQYRKKRTDPYLGGALSYGEVQEFLHRHNRPGERKCNMCDKPFQSEGAHNRRCPKCSIKVQHREDHTRTRELHEYRTTGKFRSTHHFIGEIE